MCAIAVIDAIVYFASVTEAYIFVAMMRTAQKMVSPMAVSFCTILHSVMLSFLSSDGLFLNIYDPLHTIVVLKKRASTVDDGVARKSSEELWSVCNTLKSRFDELREYSDTPPKVILRSIACIQF